MDPTKIDPKKLREIADKMEAQSRALADVSDAREINRPKADADVQALQDEIAELRNAKAAAEQAVSPDRIKAEFLREIAPMLRSLPVSEADDAQAPGGKVDREYVNRLICTPSDDPKVRRLQKAHDDIHVAQRVYGAVQQKNRERPTELVNLTHAYNDAARALGLDGAQIRATTFSTTGAATGDEWVFDLPSAALIERVDQIGNIEAQFNQFTIPGGYESVSVPGEGALPTVYTVAQSTTDSATGVTVSNPGTRQVSMTVGKHGAYVLTSAETTEDMIISSLDRIGRMIGKAHRNGLECALINGDTGSNLDSTMAAGDVNDIFNGLRETAINTLTSATKDMNALTGVDDIADVRALMGKWGVDPAQLICIASPTGYYKWLKDTNLITLDKVGPAATLLTGSLAFVGGLPLFVSGEFPANLNVSGVIDGVTTDNHAYLVVRKDAWTVTRKRELSIKVDDMSKLETDQIKVVGFRRVGFVHEHTTSDNTVAYGYNLDN